MLDPARHDPAMLDPAMLDPAMHSGTVTTPEAAEATVIEVRQLVGEYYRNVYRYAYRLCGNEADAEDLTQQTFLVVQSRLHQLRYESKVQPWIFAVLRSCFLKSRRRPRPVAAVNLELNVEDVPEHRLAESTLDQQELQQEL